jgi:hypothetical protein
LIRGKYHTEQKEKEMPLMIRGKYHKTQKEKGKAAHDKRESSKRTGAPQLKG